MVLDRSRRAFLATVGMVGLARGAEELLPRERSTPERPDSCPVSTLEGYDPPDRVLRSTVVAFVREYEEAFLRSELIDHSHEKDEVTVDVVSVTPVDAGYAVEVAYGITDYVVDARVYADALAESVTGDLPSVADLESDAIREIAVEAAEAFRERNRGSASTRVGTGGSERDAVPDVIRRDLGAVPGDDRGSYVTVDDVLVRLRLETSESSVQRDFVLPHSRYYVDSQVVRRGSGETDPGDGALLECR